jgi:hypothetical protein
MKNIHLNYKCLLVSTLWFRRSNSKDRRELIVMNIPHRNYVFHLAAEILPKPNCVLPLAGTVMSLQRFLQSMTKCIRH